ncbi:MAG: NAD-binding protein [Anaerolineales bacterium]|nr:NAD-binding protein [Anaerolineales bacterium]
MPVTRAVSWRLSRLRPFAGRTVVFGHLLVWNSLVVAEALWRGGARLVFSDAHASPATQPLTHHLRELGIRVWPVAEAVRRGDLYLDVGAVLGRLRAPAAAAEVTRTGVLHYRSIPSPVVSADDCRAKLIEGFFGTGDSFLRAWQLFRPGEPVAGRRLVLFGYGRIGRGVALRTRRAGMQVSVVDIRPSACRRAAAEGFACMAVSEDRRLRRALAQAQVVVAVTGQPGALGRMLPPAWLRAGGPTLVNLGAEDEFGPEFAEEEILGGRAVPLNFHLEQPTLNRYVDPPLAAHLLALEAVVTQPGPAGVRALPPAMDDWILRTWRAAWPGEDLGGIAGQLGLS